MIRRRGGCPLRRKRDSLAFLLVACLSACTPADDDMRRVDRVVLVSIDTLRADRVGSYGAEHAETPTLDGLAAEGARFEAAISPAPLTLPSHATLLTGLEPPEHGVRHNGSFRLDDDVPTLAERMRAADYATAGFVSAYVLDRGFGLDRGFDVYDDEIGVHHSGALGPAVPERTADRTVDRALDWLNGAPDRFFLWVHLYDPHAAYQPPEPYATRFGDRRYEGEIAFADAQVGRLLTAVRQRWRKGTLVVATSDHGESLGEHGIATHAHTIYEATQRVPLLFVGPGIRPGTVVQEVTPLSKVAPTIAQLAELPSLPGEAERSLSSRLRGEPGGGPDLAWVETLATQLDMGWSPLFGVRTQNHKYIRAPRPELYDLRADPKELRNVAEGHAEIVQRLDRHVEERIARGRSVVPNLVLDTAERARLEALGYVTEGAMLLPEDLGVVGGIDPKDEIHVIDQLHKGASLLKLQRWDESIALLEALGERGYEVTVLQAMAFLGGSRFEDAQRAAERAARISPGRSEPQGLMGQVAESLGRFADALEHYERAARLEPDAGAPLIGMGRIAELHGDREAARAHYREAIAKRRTESEAIWRLAALEIERGDEGAARELLLNLPQAELRQPPAAERLARADWIAGRVDLAHIRVNGALNAFPDDLRLMLLKADLLELQEKEDAASRARRDAWQAHPDVPAAQMALARDLARHQIELRRAEAIVEELIARFGRRPGLLEMRSLVVRIQGDPQTALDLSDEGLAVLNGPSSPRLGLLLRRAEALVALGRSDEATATLARARALHDERPLAVLDLQRVEAMIAGTGGTKRAN